ncbi:MAG: hypothetical protein U0R52_09650 [Solirubrobacterales bacterium]
MPVETIVRSSLQARERAGRTLDQRLALRFPALATANFRLIGSQRPENRLRRALLRRAAQLAIEAYNRRDLDVIVLGWAADVEYRPDRNWVRAGLVEESYRGAEGYRRYVAAIDEVWDGENYLTPLELVDTGERFVTLGRGRMRAKASGVPLAEAYALVTTLRGGRPFLHEEYYDHEEALAAAGVPG